MKIRLNPFAEPPGMQPLAVFLCVSRADKPCMKPILQVTSAQISYLTRQVSREQGLLALLCYNTYAKQGFKILPYFEIILQAVYFHRGTCISPIKREVIKGGRFGRTTPHAAATTAYNNHVLPHYALWTLIEFLLGNHYTK